MDFSQHDGMVKQLLEDYRQGTHHRVPVTFLVDEQWMLPRYACSYSDYYRSAELQLEVQLRMGKLWREWCPQDAERGLPEFWGVTPGSWTAEREYFGAEVVYQEHDYAWTKPLDLSKAALVERVRGIEARRQVPEEPLWALREEMVRLARDREFECRPVIVSTTGTSTHGPFTVAAELRGVQQLCMDLVDDPVFAEEYLAAVTDALVNRMQIWSELQGIGTDFPNTQGWGGCDDNLELISERTLRDQVLPHLRSMYDRMTTGPRWIHLCGHAAHQFKALHDEVGITTFDGPGVHVDLAAMREAIGAPIEIRAQMNHTVLMLGPREAIERMIAGILTPGAKSGKLSLMGYVVNDTPQEHVAFAYECGQKYGQVTREV